MSDDEDSTIEEISTNANPITTGGPLLASTSKWMLERARWNVSLGKNSKIDDNYPYGRFGIKCASHMNDITRHFFGKASHKQHYEMYKKQSLENQQQQLEQWDRLLREHPKLSKRIEKYINQKDDVNSLCATSIADTNIATGLSLDLHLRDASTSNVTESSTVAVPITNERPSKRPRLSETQPAIASLPTDQILVHAPLDAAKGLLPDDLFEDIVREGNPAVGEKYLAGIIMQFTNGYDDTECKMTFRIKPEVVSHYAQKWFGVRLELRDGLRYVRVPNSATVVMAQGFSGFNPLHLETEFGTEVGRAIMASRTYQKEVQQEKGGTQAVLMTISLLASEPAQVMLTMRFYEGVKIREKLYPS